MNLEGANREKNSSENEEERGGILKTISYVDIVGGGPNLINNVDLRKSCLIFLSYFILVSVK